MSPPVCAGFRACCRFEGSINNTALCFTPLFAAIPTSSAAAYNIMQNVGGREHSLRFAYKRRESAFPLWGRALCDDVPCGGGIEPLPFCG